MSSKGVDLSKWNVINSYSAMKSDGVEFAILKAINSSRKKDSRFETHVKGCNGAGINILGTYHYSYATTTVAAKEAAKAWIDAVEGRFQRFYLDWEDATLPKTQAAVNIINAYTDAIQDAGYEMALYTGLYHYNTYLRKYAANIPCDMWIARYYAGYKEFFTKDNPDERYRPSADRLIGWQYTSSGAVKGAADRLDMNIWYETVVDSKTKITAQFNPFTEPTQTVKLGTLGNDANWVLWYLWRFGMLLDSDGNPDSTKINGIIDRDTVEIIKTAQRALGAEADGKVGKITRRLFKLVC